MHYAVVEILIQSSHITEQFQQTIESFNINCYSVKRGSHYEDYVAP